MLQHWPGSGGLPHAGLVCMCWSMGRACVCLGVWGGSSEICGTQTRTVLWPFVLELGRVESRAGPSHLLPQLNMKHRFTSLTTKHQPKVQRDKETLFRSHFSSFSVLKSLTLVRWMCICLVVGLFSSLSHAATFLCLILTINYLRK